VTTISSRLTAFHKWIVPIFMFGVIVFIGVTVVDYPEFHDQPVLMLLPVALAVLPLLFRFFVWRLADEVEDHGHFLVVRRGSDEDRIALSDIERVTGTNLVNPPRVTIHLRRSSRFGDTVTFTPVMRFMPNPFGRHPIVDELTARVGRERDERRR
jgi:hypothetical protein